MGGVLAKNAGLFENSARYCARKTCYCRDLASSGVKPDTEMQLYVRECSRIHEKYLRDSKMVESYKSQGEWPWRM
jgi:hypothetical protein